MKPKIGHIIISVSDFERSEAFYDSVLLALGFKVGLDSRGEWGGIKEYASDGHSFMIINEKDKEYRKFERFPGLNHLAFKVGTAQEVDKAFAIVKELGAEITREPKEYPDYGENYYAFYFRDPDGIPLEIASY